MPIRLHCDHCGKKIEAPDNAGGKWGKCPACHNKVYVPAPPSDEELKLAPIDETGEERRARLRKEAFELTKDILEDSAVAEETPEPDRPGAEISEEELNKHIILYLRQMADGDLDEAQSTADRIVPHRRQVMSILDGMVKSDALDPELEGIPQQVLSGLIRNLRVRMS